MNARLYIGIEATYESISPFWSQTWGYHLITVWHTTKKVIQTIDKR